MKTNLRFAMLAAVCSGITSERTTGALPVMPQYYPPSNPEIYKPKQKSPEDLKRIEAANAKVKRKAEAKQLQRVKSALGQIQNTPKP